MGRRFELTERYGVHSDDFCYTRIQRVAIRDSIQRRTVDPDVVALAVILFIALTPSLQKVLMLKSVRIQE